MNDKLNMTNPIFNSNKLKLGIFGINGAGTTATTVSERFVPTWDNALYVAQAADRAGLEAIVPYARWRPFGQAGHVSGQILEPSIFAAAIGASTKYSCVMSTIHVPVMHPLVVAKQIATLDQVSNGRCGLNIVCGWFKPEMEMFGAEQREHNDRYAHADEWTTVLKRALTEDAGFDFQGKYIQTIDAFSDPKPVQRPYPPLMNAGGSEPGRAFAAKHADLAFIMITSDDLTVIAKQVQAYRTLALESHGRDIKVWSYAFVVQRNTQEEAEAYVDHAIRQNGDWGQVDVFIKQNMENAKTVPPEVMANMRVAIAAGAGGVPLVGTAAQIATRLGQLSEAGFDGILLSWVDYKNGIDDFNRDVLPLLEKAGLRAPFHTES